jgi:hypothetical protein
LEIKHFRYLEEMEGVQEKEGFVLKIIPVKEYLGEFSQRKIDL